MKLGLCVKLALTLVLSVIVQLFVQYVTLMQIEPLKHLTVFVLVVIMITTLVVLHVIIIVLLVLELLQIVLVVEDLTEKIISQPVAVKLHTMMTLSMLIVLVVLFRTAMNVILQILLNA
jgi:hypothetical protein